MANVLQTFKDRYLFEDMTSPDLEKLLDSPTTVYAGFDPTAESLQAGNFVTIMALAHLQRQGHKVIALVGGATGLIGDPSGKSKERNLLTAETVERNLEGIKENLSRFLNFDPDSENPAIMVNNYDWFKDLSFVDILRDVGRFFRMTQMLGKESVKKRLDSDEGMSFTEFCYQILQGYDFYHLYKEYGCRMQIGGSDQWGNITAGTDLVRKLAGEEVYGMTFPLVCDSNGNKFGKSEGNAVYLDANKTSYYDFYQFFLRTLDSDVIRYLKIFTFLPDERIAELVGCVETVPEKREAQKVLAEELTRCVHGDKGFDIALKATEVLFGGSIDGLGAEDLEKIFSNVPSGTLNRDDVIGKPAFEVIAAAKMTNSKGDARRLVQQGGLSINNVKAGGLEREISADDLIENRLIVLRSGKKKYFLLKVEG